MSAKTLELLESRRMFAAGDAPIFANGILRIDGTNNADTLMVLSNGVEYIADDGVHNTLSVFANTVTRIDIYGHDGNDTIFIEPAVTARANIYAAAGNDTVTGGSGNDYIVGSTGGDVLTGGPGNDSLYGGEHNDTLKADAGADLLDGGSSIDLADYSARAAAQAISLDNVANDGSAAEGDNVKDTVEDIKGGSGGDTLLGSPAANHIWGNYGKDLIRGGPGEDYLYGGFNDDTIDGQTGNDAMVGDSGVDTADYSSRVVAVDVAIGGAAEGEPNELDVVDSTIENLWGGSGADRLTGSAANNVLEGRGGRDTLHGGAGNDTLNGGNDNIDDELWGDGGNDTYFRNNIDDVMDAGIGDTIQ